MQRKRVPVWIEVPARLSDEQAVDAVIAGVLQDTTENDGILDWTVGAHEEIEVIEAEDGEGIFCGGCGADSLDECECAEHQPEAV